MPTRLCARPALCEAGTGRIDGEGSIMERSERKIVVDADACPRGAMDVLRRLQREFHFRIVTVASFHHDIRGADGARPKGFRTDETPWEHVTVGDGPDEADWAVANRTRSGDIVVTQDWGLAALVLAKGARCVSPAGYEYKPDRIEFQLDERHVKAKHRRSGGRTKGPRPRTEADDERFEATLRRLLHVPRN